MNYPSKRSLLATALVLASASVTRAADMVVYDLGDRAHGTLRSLGTDFVLGCTILAAGVIGATVLFKRK
ncbi:MAG: hypothetical protein V4675_00855 [Verrucomicrobiota bacterium]